MFVSPLVLAQEVPPHDWHDKVERFLDLGSPPEVVIWDTRLAARDSPALPNRWSRNVWVCHSDSDDTFGACATTPTWGGNGPSIVKLRFTETRSGEARTLEVLGSRWLSESTINRPLHGSSSFGATSVAAVYIDVRIPPSELKKLPVGGVWKAHLKFKQILWGTAQASKVADTNAEITLHVTDTKNVQIYLPGHNTTAPTVDLGLSQPNGRDSRTTGSRSIDMCLYDGFGSNSSWFDVTVKDDLGALRRKPGSFSVVRHGTAGEFHDRIDYGVSYLHEGQQKALNNGETVRLIGGNGTGLRSVHLPNIPVAVMCKSMPLTLETPEFNAKDKRAGSYSGKLRIIFSPSAQSL
ncbi:CfaE/CblD family pilus tip adhesin [Burkholderia gladioli]|nr:CfaE/CblD family pilus tip adhesin [Burkholderia gladioli]MDN7923150.1 CfaE/CblD family pilus tip adhesin [Burkholderia gladioli]